MVTLPSNVLTPLGEVQLLKTVDLDVPNAIGADPAAIRADLLNQGYSIRQTDDISRELPIRDGKFRVHCTIHSLHGQAEQTGVLALEIRHGTAKVIVSMIPGTDEAREYLDVRLQDLMPNLHPQAQAEYLIAEPLDGRRLQSQRLAPPE